MHITKGLLYLSICLILNSCELTGDPYIYMKPSERKAMSVKLVSEARKETKIRRKTYKLKKALRFDPENDTALFELANAAKDQDDIKTWKYYIDQAIEVAPSKWTFVRGYHYLSHWKDYNTALVDFFKATKADSNGLYRIPFTEQKILTAICYYHLGETDKALEYMENYKSETKRGQIIDPSAYIYPAYHALLMGKYDESKEICKAGLEVHQEISQLHYLLYQNALFQKDSLSSDSIWNNITSLTPDTSAVFDHIGLLIPSDSYQIEPLF